MKSLRSFLNEAFVNAIGTDDKAMALKDKYADQVWDVLQTSYKDIGGIQGKGFKNKEDMKSSIPFWKMSVKDGKVVAVIMYKGAGGRKSVAMGTDKSIPGKKAIMNMLPADIHRSFGEKSKGALGALMKTVPWSVLEPLVLKPAEVTKVTGKDVTPISEYKGDMPQDGKDTLAKYPELKPFAYIRNFGGEDHFKVSFGKPGIPIRK